MRCDARTKLFCTRTKDFVRDKLVLYTFKTCRKRQCLFVWQKSATVVANTRKTFNNHTIDPHSIDVIRYSSTCTTAQLRVSRGVHPRSIFIKERHPAGMRVLLVQESVF